MTNPVSNRTCPTPEQVPTAQGAPAQATGRHPDNGQQVRILAGGGEVGQDLPSTERGSQLLEMKLAHLPEPRPLADYEVAASPSPSPPDAASSSGKPVSAKAQEPARVVTGSDEIEMICLALIARLIAGDEDESNTDTFELCTFFRPGAALPQFEVADREIQRLLGDLNDILDENGEIPCVDIIRAVEVFLEEARLSFHNRVMLVTETVYLNFLDLKDDEKHWLFDRIMRWAGDVPDALLSDYIKAELADIEAMPPAERGAYLRSPISPPPLDRAAPELRSRLESLPCGDTAYPLMRFEERGIAAISFGRLRIPYYQSSGMATKPGVFAGNWYPFFGIGSDRWFNKLENDDQHTGNYYGSEKLREMASLLDGFCDARFAKSLPEVDGESAQDVIDFLNRDMKPIAIVDKGIDVVLLLVDLVEADDAKARLAAAENLAEWEWNRTGQTTDADRDAFMESRIAHYVQLVSPGQPLQQPEQT